MAENTKLNKFSGSVPGVDFDDPHHDYVANKTEETPAATKPDAGSPAKPAGTDKTDENPVVSEPAKP